MHTCLPGGVVYVPLPPELNVLSVICLNTLYKEEILS